MRNWKCCQKVRSAARPSKKHTACQRSSTPSCVSPGSKPGKVKTGLRIATPATIKADRQMLVQAMANLIQNALVHGGPDIDLIANGTRLGVADNGAGVDPAQFDEIVKPMVRLEGRYELCKIVNWPTGTGKTPGPYSDHRNKRCNWR